MTDVYEWHDAFGELAQRQSPPRSVVRKFRQVSEHHDPEAVDLLGVVGRQWGVERTRATMEIVGGVTRLVQVPKAEQLDFVRRVKADMERSYSQ